MSDDQVWGFVTRFHTAQGRVQVSRAGDTYPYKLSVMPAPSSSLPPRPDHCVDMVAESLSDCGISTIFPTYPSSY